jgi:hypothetical protein
MSEAVLYHDQIDMESGANYYWGKFSDLKAFTIFASIKVLLQRRGDRT